MSQGRPAPEVKFKSNLLLLLKIHCVYKQTQNITNIWFQSTEWCDIPFEKILLHRKCIKRNYLQLSWQDESGSLIAAAVNSSSVRHGVDLFRTISDLPLVATRGSQYGGGGQKIFCMAHNSAQTRSSSISIIVQFKPEIELTQINTMGTTLQFR